MKSFRANFSSLIRSTRPFAGRLAIICALGAMQVALALACIVMTERVVNIAAGTTDAPFVKNILILVGATVLSNLIARQGGYLQGLISIKYRNSRRDRLFRKMLESRWNGKESNHSGDTVSRLMQDVNTTSSFISSGFPASFIAMCRFVIATIYLFLRQPKLGWILIFIAPLAAIAVKLYSRPLLRLNRETRSSESAVQQFVQETVQHRMLIKTMDGTDHTFGHMSNLQNGFKERSLAKLKYQSVSGFFIKAGFSIGYLVVFIWSVVAVRNGAMTYGLLVAMLQLVSQIQDPVFILADQYGSFIAALCSEERLMDIDNLEGESGYEQVQMNGTPGIKVDNVTFRYQDGDCDVLKDFSHDFKPGTITAILGLTGIGKSTLSRLMMALLQPSQGEILLYDSEHSLKSTPGTRCNFMYVPQGNSLLSGTIRENLMLAAPEATDEEMRDALHVADADFVFDLPSGLDSVCAETGGGLSEGQAQRIAIARAMLRPGGILIMDEASSSLDSATEQRILERLTERCRGRKTIIFITHREAMVSFADEIVKI